MNNELKKQAEKTFEAMWQDHSKLLKAINEQHEKQIDDLNTKFFKAASKIISL